MRKLIKELKIIFFSTTIGIKFCFETFLITIPTSANCRYWNDLINSFNLITQACQSKRLERELDSTEQLAG